MLQNNLLDIRRFIVPKTQGIKYAGSKLKIIPYIIRLMESINGAKTFLDGFSGTTRVSQAMCQLGFDTTANDISVWSEVFANCYLKSSASDSYYNEIISHLNSLNGTDGWFTENYGGQTVEKKKPFQIKNTRKLDAIRDEIENLNLNFADKCVILTSLILALDEVDSTLGHYASYLSEWSARSYKDLYLKLPRKFPIKTTNTVIKSDIFDTITKNSYDIAYFDPPYGSNNERMPPSRVRYSAYYHLWKSVILHDRPQVFGKANRREDSRDTVDNSVFEEYKKTPDGRYIAINAIGKLIKNTNANYIILSYSSGGRATKSELLDILRSNGNILRVVEIDYKKNVMSTMTWTNEWIAKDIKNKEYLFLLQK